jgi:purine-cytosine permease-like protein
MDDITDFLYLIGSVFAPMIAVQIADYFILKEDDSERMIDWKNMVVWLLGFLLYRMLMRIDTPVGNTLPDILLTIVLSLTVNSFARSKK